MNRVRKFKLILCIGFVSIMMATYGIALAVHDLGIFELDRNATDEGGILGDDWGTLNYNGNEIKFTGILPDVAAPGTQFQGGGSKDDLDISSWLWKPGEPLDKDDITNAYAAAYLNPIDTGKNDVGDLIFYFGLDRFSTAGSAQVGFWFLQDPNFGLTDISRGGGYEFSGVHQDNDILVQSNFTNGGVISNITVYKWQAGSLIPLFTAADCIGSPPDAAACATVNQSPQTAPWPYTPKANEGVAGTFQTSAFFEGGINITRLVPDAGCFTGFVAETRSSTPFDARLKDFVTDNLELCSLKVTKSGDTLSKVGDPINYTITIENTGGIKLYKDDISDTLLGDIAINGVDQANPYVLTNTCGAYLLPGNSCTITLQRSVQASDLDPLVNTANVTYRGKSDLSGQAVSGSDDHSVNLFQPGVSVEKTGDTLSKVGDPVDYTITITNTSSSDSPNLINGTVVDTLLGDLLDPSNTYVTSSTCSATLATSASCTIHATRTVLNTDPDPLPNTVTVHYNPSGFPNDITDSDDHSVNLFQPAINIDKTGDTLSKIGDSVDYVFTLSNTSSADTPAITCTVTDTHFGTIFNSVLPLGDTVINRSRTVQAGDPDPLGNTVNMSCTIAGFSNLLNDSDTHSVNLFQPGVEIIKTGPATGYRGQLISYNFTINNLSSIDSPNLILDSVTDTVLGSLTTTAASNGCTSLAPGGSCSFSVNYTIQAVDPNPLINVVTVHYHPSGFPNDVTDWDDHTLDIFVIDGCTPGFWQGGAGSQLWNQENDPQWTYGGTNPFIHTTLFNGYFNVITASRLNGLTMMDLVGSGGTSDPARKAARDMVAAYLNEAAFPGSFPATSLDDLKTMWYAAVAGGDSALDAFHTTVSAWNDPPGGSCPLP